MIRQRYLLQDPMDYRKYNALCGSMRQMAHKLSQLDPETDPVRKKLESELLDKLWRMGILKQSREQGAALSRVEREVTVSAFCRRRLAVLMVRSGLVQTIKAVRSPYFHSGCRARSYGRRIKLIKRRQPPSSNKATSASEQRLSPTLLSSSLAIWRTLSPGSTPARSSGILCGTRIRWMTLTCCD